VIKLVVRSGGGRGGWIGEEKGYCIQGCGYLKNVQLSLLVFVLMFIKRKFMAL